jgi:hypothetical protein
MDSTANCAFALVSVREFKASGVERMRNGEFEAEKTIKKL